MPIFEYRATDAGCDHCEAGFEQLHRKGDPTLEHCPRCGAPVERCLSAFAVQQGKPDTMSQKNLEKNGFTRYEKTADGRYEKTAGLGGPQVIEKKTGNSD